MRYWVGFDVGKSFHWVCVLDEEGKEVLSRKVEATEEDLEASCSEIERLGGERTVGIDLLGGPATLLEAVLLGRGERVFHVPGIAVNRARDAYPGEAKSDSKDAHVIADQLRLRSGSLHEVCPGTRPPPRCGCSPPTAGICSKSRLDARPAYARSCWECFQVSRRPWTSEGRPAASGDEGGHACHRPQTRHDTSVPLAQGAGRSQGPRSRRADR